MVDDFGHTDGVGRRDWSMVVLGRSGYAWFLAGAGVFVAVGMGAVGSWQSAALDATVFLAAWVVDATGFVRVRDGVLEWRQWLVRKRIPVASIVRLRVSDTQDVAVRGAKVCRVETIDSEVIIIRPTTTWSASAAANWAERLRPALDADASVVRRSRQRPD